MSNNLAAHSSSSTRPKYDVFLSHNSSDKPFVEQLAKRLEDEAKLKPFLDKWHLVPGEPWQEALEKALDESATCAVFLGASGLGSWENEEMRSVLDDRVKNKSFRVIPVLLPGAVPKNKETLPRFLRRFTWVDFSHELNNEEAFRCLVAGIQGQPPGRDSNSKTAPPTPKPKLYKRILLCIGVLFLSTLLIWGILKLKTSHTPLDSEVVFAMSDELAKQWSPRKEVCRIQIQGRENSGVCFQNEQLSLLKSPLNQRSFNRYQNFTAVFGIRFLNGKGGAWIARAQDFKNYYSFEVTPPANSTTGAMLTFCFYKKGEKTEIKKILFSPEINQPADSFIITITATDNQFEHTVKRLKEDEAHPLEVLPIPSDLSEYRSGGFGFQGINSGEIMLQRFEIHPITPTSISYLTVIP